MYINYKLIAFDYDMTVDSNHRPTFSETLNLLKVFQMTDCLLNYFSDSIIQIGNV